MPHKVRIIVINGTMWTKDQMKEFKKLYNAALEAKQEIFMVKGQEVLTAYAKYLIEYAENELGPLLPRTFYLDSRTSLPC